ncbi:MAG: malto-oligosyltrehalose trehalohydrolase [Firmicutes bacterium HGW-Firmicutes-12]|nr:MAG: malto-oligosyltrehalose trehalohydrolase [Firmicutes bacterium HGW-Firmicutes-12]
MGGEIISRQNNIVRFNTFAYNRKSVNILIKTGEGTIELPMLEKLPHIYTIEVSGLGLDLLYKFRFDDKKSYPDPYSYFQPNGVHGFSQVVDHDLYNWQDRNWKGKSINELIIMELHVGTFTPEGTLQKAIEKIPYLVDLGITAVEIMPITQTPGKWNWGYDGVNLFSVNHNYGIPDDLKAFIDQCHQHDLAVILDVVYNHFGPEGNFLSFFGPYFTEKHQTPWGRAVNFDDKYCEFTRKMVLDNVRYWLETYHFDGLRLDAVHAIKDDSTPHILEEIATTAHYLASQLKRHCLVIAESDENNAQLITSIEEGGYGLDAQWLDDFHHVLHTALTGENEGYYMDYDSFENFIKVFSNYLYTGQYSRFWKKNRGSDGSNRPGNQFVIAIQNHDQIGNRAQGDRLPTLVDFPFLKAAAGVVFISAYIPLIFMGEEYGETRPFLFFTDYQDPHLQKAVSEGRRKEFSQFSWGEFPDPQDPNTFLKSKLQSKDGWDEQNTWLYNYYRDLIKLRLSHPVLKKLDKKNLEVTTIPTRQILTIKRWNEDLLVTAVFNLGLEVTRIEPSQGKVIFNSERQDYGGKAVEKDKNTLTKGQLIIYESKL